MEPIAFTPEFVAGLRRQLGDATADTLLNPPRSQDGTKARIQRPSEPHSKAMAALLGELMPGHEEQLCVGRPCDMATSVAVVTTYQKKVVLGRKCQQDRHYIGKYCLAPAGWFDDTKDDHLIATIIREGIEEVRFRLDYSRIYDLGRFVTINVADNREADFPSHKTGYLYELNTSELEGMLLLDCDGSGTELAEFQPFDEEGFELLVQKLDIVFPDQIWFIRRYFKLLRNNALGNLEPIAHEGSTADTLAMLKQA